MIQFDQQSQQLNVTVDEIAFEGGYLSRFEAEISQMGDHPVHSVAIDFSNVDRIDSRGLDTLLDLKARFENAAASFRLTNVRPSVSKVIRLLGATSCLNVQSSN